MESVEPVSAASQGAHVSLAWQLHLATVVSVLLGSSCALLVVGLSARLDQLMVNDRYLPGAVVCACLLSMALGVRLPQQFAIWMSALAWRRFARRRSGGDTTGGVLDAHAANQSLHWLVLAVTALAAGVGIALLPVSARYAVMAYEWLLDRFVWSSMPALVLQMLVPLVCALLPGAVLGLAATIAHRLSCVHGTWQTRATGWMLFGASGGLILAFCLFQSNSRPDLVLLTSSLPTLAVALVAGLTSFGNLRPPETPAERDATILPQWSDRWPRLLRAGIVAVGGGASCMIVLWMQVLTVRSGNSMASAAVLIAALGFGILMGGWTRLPRIRSIGGFGTACLVAGIDCACGSIIAAHQAELGEGALHWSAFACVAVVGFAVGYGRQTLLRRVARRPSAGASILGNKLICCALTVWVGAPAAVTLVGVERTFVLVAISLVALGGLLIIHEPTYSRRTRVLRVLAVFASIGVMIAASFLYNSDQSPASTKSALLNSR